MRDHISINFDESSVLHTTNMCLSIHLITPY